MRSISLFRISIFAAVIALVSAGCATTGTTPVTNPGGTFDNCSDAAMKTAAESILGDVTTALATGNYIAALATLAVTYGEPELVCAVQLAVNELQGRLDATPTTSAQDPLLLTEVANGKAWLATHGGGSASR